MRTEDGHIIYECLNGDSAAFGLLVDKYKASIYALAYSKLHNFHDAEDVTQEAFIKAYRKLRTLRWWDNFLAWLYAITSNLCRDFIRSQSKRPDGEFLADQEPDALNRPSINSYRDGLMRESVHDALNSLPDSYRQVLTLYYLGGMSSIEIARFLGTSPNNIAQRLKRARSKLKEEMIAMMGKTYEQQRLHETFTFRVVEMVKRIKIRPVPRISWLPWGVSVAVGVILGIMNFASPLLPLNSYRGPMSGGGEKVELPLVLNTGRTAASMYNQRVEMLAYMDITADSEIVPGGNERSENATPSESLYAGQGDDQAAQSEQPLLASAALAAAANAKEKVVISGKVVKDNRPVANAEVYVYDTDKGTKIATASTKSDGSFKLEMPKPENWGKLTVFAQHPDYSFGKTELSEDNTANLIIELYQPMSISGTVVDKAGNPIRGADAEITGFHILGVYTRADGIPGASMKTDASGRFALRNLPPRLSVNINISGAGYATERRIGIQSGAEGIAFKLNPESRIEGRVTFAGTGKPAEGILVYAHGQQPVNIGHGRCYVDAKGNYALTNLPAGGYRVFFGDLPDSWVGPTEQEDIEVAEGQKVSKDFQLLNLANGGLITGRITDKDTGEPIKNHRVAVSRQSEAMTDENGSYQLRAVPGKIQVSTSAPSGYLKVGQIRKSVDVAMGKTTSGVDFQFARGDQLSISARVLTTDGEPVAEAVITDRMEMGKGYGTSDEDGRFVISGLQAGQKISVRALNAEKQLRGYADLEAQQDAEVEILAERYELTEVPGRVVNRQGQSVPSANIGLLRWDREIGRGISSSVTMGNAAGEYKISGLIIGDEYSVSASADGYRGSETKLFTATANMPPLQDIVLPPQGSFFLEGTVTDMDGKPIAGARVMPASMFYSAKTTDADGHYRIDNLPFAVLVELNIDHPNYGYSEFRYVPTNGTQNFKLVKADGYLEGEVVDVNGLAVEKAAVSLESSSKKLFGHVNIGDMTDIQGRFSLKHLLVGETESVYVGKGKIYKVFDDVKMNRDDAVFVLEKSAEPEKPLSTEEIARRKYRDRVQKSLEELPGKPAPEPDAAKWLNGKPVKLADAKGKVVVLYFWNSQSEQDVEALRLVNTLQKEYGDSGLVCVGIHEPTTQVDQLQKLIAEKKIAFPVAVDKESPTEGATGVTFDRYALTGSRLFMVINKAGVIDCRMWDRSIEGQVQKLLAD